MKLHVLTGNASINQFLVVVHANVPAGSNAAGVTWADAVKGSGLGTTILTTGSAAGQITTAEANQIANGTVIEASFTWQNHDAWDNTTRLADLNAKADEAIAARLASLANELKWFGYKVA